MMIDGEHVRLWERAEAWEARAKTRETRASMADMGLRRVGAVARSLAVELVTIRVDLLLGFLRVEIEVPCIVNTEEG